MLRGMLLTLTHSGTAMLPDVTIKTLIELYGLRGGENRIWEWKAVGGCVVYVADWDDVRKGTMMFTQPASAASIMVHSDCLIWNHRWSELFLQNYFESKVINCN
jgi:hypothetical protein